MPHPRSNLDIICCSADMHKTIDEADFEALIQSWKDNQWIDSKTAATGDDLIQHGFSRVWLDKQDKPTLYANNQGGFKVHCIHCNAPVARPFSKAVTAWRAGGPREIKCWACQKTSPLEDQLFAPPAAFSTGAIVFSDISVVHMSGEAVKGIESILGPYKVVLRRLA